MSDRPVQEFLRSLFQGQALSWPQDLNPEAFLAYTERQGLQPLLLHLGKEIVWPASIRQELLRVSGLEALKDAAVRRELPRVLAALAQSGIHPVLLKGTPLSFSVYPSAGLRPRADTDLLIAHADVEAAHRVLSSLDYTTANSIAGDHVLHQRAYAGAISLDVHWKVLNPAMFSDLLTFDDLRSQAVAVPALGPQAVAAGSIHALLLACVHRVAHHGADNSDRLIWLYDIHLLLQNMDAAAFHEFAKLAAALQMRSLCRAGIHCARIWFGTTVIDDALLNEAAEEPSAEYLQPGLSRLKLLRLDWRHAGGRRLHLLREHLFPPADYMFTKYRTRYRLLLPALYVHRVLKGLLRGRK